MAGFTHTRLLIRGRVQGVGYRAWFAREAGCHSLAGWVRNRRDGSVEAWLAAPPDRLAGLVDAAYRGPPAAQVDIIEITQEAADPGVTDSFAVLPTV